MFLTEMEASMNDSQSEHATVVASRSSSNDVTNNDITGRIPQNTSSMCSVPQNKLTSQPVPQTNNFVIQNGSYKTVEAEYKHCDVSGSNSKILESRVKNTYVTDAGTEHSDVLPTIPVSVMDSSWEQGHGNTNSSKDIYNMDNLDSMSENGDMLVINTDCTEEKQMEPDKDDERSRRSLRHKIRRRNVPEKSRKKRQTLQDMTRLLKQWLYQHKDNPYPTKSEKTRLAKDSDLTLTQVSNWFANARRRLKNTVKDPGMPWSTRIKVYNDHVTGNAELLSVSSEDSAWESDTERHYKDDKQESETKVEETNNRKCVNIHTQTTTAAVQPMDTGSQPIDTQAKIHLAETEIKPPVTQSIPPAPVTQNTGQVVLNPNILPIGPYNKMWMENFYLSQDKLVHANGGHPETVHTNMEPKFVQHNATNDTSVQINSGEELLEPPRDGAVSPPKYKQTILQRYLHDSCTHSFQMPMSPPSVSVRHRHPSGSVGSHDFEDISISSRDSPVTLAEKSEDDDLYWLEISAAMALTTLARSRVK